MQEIISVFSLDPLVRDLCKQYLDVYPLEFHSNWKQLSDSMTKSLPHLILFDYSFFIASGPQFIEDFCTHSPAVPFLLLTHCDCSYFMRWFSKIGVRQVVHLPCDKEKFQRLIADAFNTTSVGQSYEPVPLPTCPKLEKLLGDSEKMQELKKLIYHLSQTDTPLLLTGESGTGKTYLARIVHDLSPRMNSPFCAVNMSSIPISLAESELFGTAKGAYTDAISRDGYFSSAELGTLFLDEIGELPAAVQPKLLHVLEEQTYSKVGSTKELRCNTRFIFATNSDLRFLVERGLFRSDLYYRISILPIEIPPLRERKADIPQLAQYFLQPYNKDLSSASVQKLMDHHWPGNVRELKNCMVRASILSSQEMIPEGCISF